MSRSFAIRFCILTTDTLHHRYFLREVASRLPNGTSIAMVVLEEKTYPWHSNAKRWIRQYAFNPVKAIVGNPYLQPASFTRRQDDFERRRFFPDGNAAFPEELDIKRALSCNGPDSVATIRDAGADVLFVYGTGKLDSAVFEGFPLGAYNAHGGFLPAYRGLDTNLWAALQGDCSAMGVTIHELATDLDTGAVVMEKALTPIPEASIYSLRYMATITCIEMFLDLAETLAKRKKPDILQKSAIRSAYYGPMPWLLKLKANKVLESWAKPVGQ